MSPMGSDDAQVGSITNPYNNAGDVRPPKGDPYAKAATKAAKMSGKASSGKKGGGGKRK